VVVGRGTLLRRGCFFAFAGVKNRSERNSKGEMQGLSTVMARARLAKCGGLGVGAVALLEFFAGAAGALVVAAYFFSGAAGVCAVRLS
jgi:hypothetical protein